MSRPQAILITLTGLLSLILLQTTSGQSNTIRRKFWQPLSISGAVRIGGSYRSQAGFTNEIYNYQKSTLLSGGIKLLSNSYFWHPNFLTVDLGLEYNPELGKDLFLVVPDQAEVRTMKKLDITGTFFNHRKFTVNAFLNYSQVFTNRENLSNIRSNSLNWGGSLSYANKILPLTASYVHSKWDETEILTGRTFNTIQQNFQARIDRSFSTRDKNELIYYHNDFLRKEINFVSSRNISDNFLLNNSYSFDKNRRFNFHSSISAVRQTGSEAYDRMQADENLSVLLPANFTISGNYTYYDFRRQMQNLQQHTIVLQAGHRLFQSLSTNIAGEYYRISQAVYKEENLNAGFDIQYEKRIPKGNFTISYAFKWQNQNRESSPVTVIVNREPHLLTDGKIEMLNKPFIDIQSVMVRDRTGTIIYQINFDYVLIPRSNFIEIQRVPGGQIPDKTEVFIDYAALLPGSYRYNASYHNITASVTLFSRLIELYGRYSKQNYTNIETENQLELNFFNQTTLGTRLEYKFASGGVEYELYNSTIMPYKLIRYYLMLQGTYFNRLTFTASGNMRDYTLTYDMTRQTYIDATAKASYAFSQVITCSIEAGYRKQVGTGIDLDLLTGRIELVTRWRQMFIRAGFEFYKRDYLSEKTNLIGGYFQVIRTFNWYKK